MDAYEIHQQLDALHEDLDGMKTSLDIPALEAEAAALSARTEAPEFWEDQEAAQKILKKLTVLRAKTKTWQDLAGQVDDLDVMVELMEEGETVDEFEAALADCQQDMKAFRLETLLSGEYDSGNAIIAIHPGAGGTESNDWAEMLLRMYTRWAERRGFTVKTLDLQPGDVAGVKSATLLIEGVNAYGYLKTERGVHRLVRISPFDASGRRHTSFASLDVSPQVDGDVDIDINPDDIRVDTYRASGAGGQHVNKTSSAVRMTHIPTGVVVQCQNERSQHQNREVAMSMLKARLIEILEQENKEKIDDLKGNFGQIAWGSQIRSYVFHPYTMVKDHRTSEETGNIQAVMDGEIDAFINARLLQMAAENEP